MWMVTLIELDLCITNWSTELLIINSWINISEYLYLQILNELRWWWLLDRNNLLDTEMIFLWTVLNREIVVGVLTWVVLLRFSQ